MKKSSLQEQIESYILPIDQLAPSFKKKFEEYTQQQSFSLVMRKNRLYVKTIFQPFQSKNIFRFPCYVQFNFIISESIDSIKGQVMRLMRMLPTKPILKEEMDVIKNRIICELEKLCAYVDLKNITFHYLDDQQCGDNSLEAHLASYLLQTFLNNSIWPLYIPGIAGLEDYFDSIYKKEKVDFLASIDKEKSNIYRSGFDVAQKTGSNFFGIEADLMTFSLSAHKDTFQDATNKVKEMMHYFEYPDRDGSFKFWLTHYTLRSGYSTWRREISLSKIFFE
ncbi:MAG: hypothetical protein HEEMFOPI_00191 [Holosporales bacterium]